MRKPKFEYHRSKADDQWYWRLKARNGKVIAVSEGYKTKRACLGGIESVRSCAGAAGVEDD